MMNVKPISIAQAGNTAGRSAWLFSWPLIVGALVYLFALAQGEKLLVDGDTYWHIATGRWILDHGAVPSQDPFSHTMRGAPWTAHEWLSEVVLAVVHGAGSWTGVVALTVLAFAATIALLVRFLLKSLEPIHALLFAALAVGMTTSHLLVRPHVLAMPLMMVWTIGLVRACESGRAPSLWLLPVMTLWANMHGGFTLGLALASAFALEALLIAKREQRLASTAKSWGFFLALALGSSLITPHGTQGIWYTWEVLFESHYALEQIGEWRSPNFQKFQPLELWLLAGLALALHQGLRLPPIRLLLLLGLIHLALKHARYIELLGLLAPLFLASPLAAHWRNTHQSQQHLETADRLFRRLAKPAGQGAVLMMFGIFLSWTLWIFTERPQQPAKSAAPTAAIQAVRNAGVKGPVLNYYGWGGYLIYARIPPFIDGRSDMYRDEFLRMYIEALALKSAGDFKNLLDDYKIEWTLLPPNAPAVALLDYLPGWTRLHTDKVAVVHVNAKAHLNTNQKQATAHLLTHPTDGQK